ncbi:hypothetical protein SUBVAR_04035, partial [Subdoligranulum variabile DSM 15176]
MGQMTKKGTKNQGPGAPDGALRPFTEENSIVQPDLAGHQRGRGQAAGAAAQHPNGRKSSSQGSR